MIGRFSEELGRLRTPMRHRRQRQIFLAAEMVKEAALGEPGLGANVVDARRAVALGTDDFERRVQKPGFRFVWLHRVHTHW